MIEGVAEQSLPEGMTVRIRAALEVLLVGSATVPEIARRLHIKRQFTQVMVNEAIESGFAVSVENPAHARSKLIELTEKGREAIIAIRANETEILGAIAKELSDDDIAITKRVIDHLFNGFQQRAEQ